MFDVCIGLTDTRSLWVLFWKLSAGYKPKQELQRDLQPKVSFYCLKHDQPKYVNLTSGKAKAKIFQKWKINSRAKHKHV